MRRSALLPSLLACLSLACGDSTATSGEAGAGSSGAMSTTSGGDPVDASSGVGAGDGESSSADVSDATTMGSPDETSSTSDASDDTTGGGESSSSSSGGSVLPFDCDDGDLPVRVAPGGTYSSILAAVMATPPGGTV